MQRAIHQPGFRHLLSALVTCGGVLVATGCDRELPRSAEPSAPTAPSSSPAPTPTPTPPAQYVATPVPFNLTESRMFDILGWDSWPAAPVPSATQFRWNAAIAKYEVLAFGLGEWSRLEAKPTIYSVPYDYDVFGSDGARLAFNMLVAAPLGHVGNARIFEGQARAFFAFGIATAPGDVPRSGTMTCDLGEDEIGGVGLTFDLAAGTVSGWAEPFWGGGIRYQLVQTRFSPGATTFSATFGTGGVLDGRFFGPQAVNAAVRADGGGSGFKAVRGIMTGTCRSTPSS
jgi:hypothetical protein